MKIIIKALIICIMILNQACSVLEEKPEISTDYTNWTVTLYKESETDRVWVISERPKGNIDDVIYFTDNDGNYTEIHGDIVIVSNTEVPGLLGE